MFELAEEALDEVAFAVERGVDGALDFAVRAGRNVGLAAAALDEFDDRPRVVAAVGDKRAAGREAFDNRGRQGFVGSLPWRQNQANGQTLLVDRGVDLGAQSSTRTTDGVIWAPFFPPAACWRARIIERSINCSDCGDLAANASNTPSQIPFFAQRLKRL